MIAPAARSHCRQAGRAPRMPATRIAQKANSSLYLPVFFDIEYGTIENPSFQPLFRLPADNGFLPNGTRFGGRCTRSKKTEKDRFRPFSPAASCVTLPPGGAASRSCEIESAGRQSTPQRHNFLLRVLRAYPQRTDGFRTNFLHGGRRQHPTDGACRLARISISHILSGRLMLAYPLIHC